MSIDSVDDNESPCEKALRNPLVLQNIFKFLPTGLLLSSCSLVNKSWNNQTRTFIRDNRICTVVTTGSTDGTFCQFLNSLDEFCGQITKTGRIVPFNSLIFNFVEEGKGRQCALYSSPSTDEQLNIHNLKSQLKLLHLDIDLHSSWYHCRVHKPMNVLLRDNSDQLRSLKLEGIMTLEKAGWDPNFPHLKFLSISSGTLGGRGALVGMKLDIVRRVLDSAPNLNRLVAKDLDTLRTVPENKYKLLEEIEFTCTLEGDAILYDKIMAAKPRLKTLRIFPLFSSDRQSDQQQSFDATLEKLLQTYHQSLRTVSIVGAYEGFGRLSHPSLVNLSKFRMEPLHEVKKAEFYNTLSAIDYANQMPRLEEAEFVPPVAEWRPGNGDAVVQGCGSTVRKLTLTINSAASNLPFFARTFPNISCLKIICTLLAGGIPFSEIWELWPRLEELEVSGDCLILRDSYDAEFCGIHPEEAKILREKDDEYLKTVNIVPIRPSILTMKSKSDAFHDVQ